MDNKNIIVSFANRNRKRFEGKTPTECFNDVKEHPGLNELMKIWSAEDIITFIFLLTTKTQDLSSAYDLIKNQMYGYQIIKLIEEDPSVECDYCEGRGYESCEYCAGMGQISCDLCDDGDIECDVCSGSGKDDGDDCGSCDGRGYNNCEDCNEGYVDCQQCHEGDAECNNCDGAGLVKSYDKMEYDGKQIITYNPKILGMIEDDYTKVSEDLYTNAESKYYNLLLKEIGGISDEFLDFEVGNVLLVQVIENQALNLKKRDVYSGGYKIISNEFDDF